MLNFACFLPMNRIVNYFKCLKFWYGDRTITLNNREDTYEYTFKVPLYCRISQIIFHVIIENLYGLIWKVFPYSWEFDYKYGPREYFYNKWLSNIVKKYDL
jgi:hypothetical protein